jgi:hypothetical protein
MMEGLFIAGVSGVALIGLGCILYSFHLDKRLFVFIEMPDVQLRRFERLRTGAKYAGLAIIAMALISLWVLTFISLWILPGFVSTMM